MSNLIGQSLGRYHILEQLGEGGMATVYKAFDTRLETDVAVKVIRTENLTLGTMERALKRFEREAKALARLTHPNIVKVTDYGEHEGKPYLVMEYLPGGTLKQKLGKPLAWQEAARLLIPIAEALDFAHSQNMIHRDVKPSNILLTERGQPMLTDFGIAKILDLEETADLTGTGMGIGTPEYMAPEQWTGKTSTLSDQYALGVVLYEMLTGRKPYSADTPAAILLKQATEPLQRPSLFSRELPEKVERLLLKALAKNPEDRYASTGEFASALENTVIGDHASRSVSSHQASVSGKVKGEKVEPIGAGTSAVRDTLATVNQMEGSTIKDAPAPRPAPKIAPAASSNWIRYWPFGLIAVLVVALIFALAGNTNKDANSFPTEAPVMATEPSVVTEAPVAPTEPPIVTEAPVAPTEPPIATEAPAVLDEITDAQGVAMRLVPAGEFTMGSDSGDDDEKPIHQVYLGAYYMDTYEVTNALYEACVSAGVCDPPYRIGSNMHIRYYGNSEYDDYPVLTEEWDQAETYCEWRGARLPTEAEWEKAARGTDGRTYPWGNDLPNSDLLNSVLLNIGDTTEVGKFPTGASIYGVLDMAGNVWEWVMDWYDASYYANSPSRNPQGPVSGENRVLRGGSWSGRGSDTRVSNRDRYNPDYWSSVGFRCSRSIP